MIDTHYMYRPPVLDAGIFNKFAADVRVILVAVPDEVLIRGETGTGEPEVSRVRIALNGDRHTGQDHEPLLIEQTYSRSPLSRMRDGEFFDFCKTNGKPYDLVVVAVLLALAYHFPACRIATDSGVPDLEPGLDLFRRACKPIGDPINLLQLFHRSRA